MTLGSFRPDKRIVIVEQFNEKLILKQEHSPLHIIDLLNSSVVQAVPSFDPTTIPHSSPSLPLPTDASPKTAPAAPSTPTLNTRVAVT